MDLKADPEDVDYKRPAPIEVFATRSTLHGISHMFTYERKYVKRSLWIVFFLASLGVLVMVCVDRVQFYFEYPHVTKLDEVAASMIVFPAVTFCNLNSFRFSQVTHNDLYHVSPAAKEALLALLDFKNFLPPPLESQPSMKELLDRLGHQLEEMLLYCRYQGEPCGPRNFSIRSFSYLKQQPRSCL
uniref:Si:dkey-57c15.1 n=1 Tax=Xiphophorus couchianus TaxID=32473 RepID=A0A3B5MFA4_9TELE